MKVAGFKTAVSTVAGDEVTQQNLYFLPRIRPGARTQEALINHLNQKAFTEF